MRDKLIAMVTRRSSRDHDGGHENLLDVARKAAERTMKKKAVVVASEVDVEDSGRPLIPAGRTRLRIVS